MYSVHCGHIIDETTKPYVTHYHVATTHNIYIMMPKYKQSSIPILFVLIHLLNQLRPLYSGAIDQALLHHITVCEKEI